MGYGIDTKKFPTRKWGNSIVYRLVGEGRAKFDDALAAWQKASGIVFTERTVDLKSAADPDVTVRICDDCCWSPPDELMGKDPHGGNELKVRKDSTVGTIIHEIGHMLGLCHEQDRPDPVVVVKVVDKESAEDTARRIREASAANWRQYLKGLKAYAGRGQFVDYTAQLGWEKKCYKIYGAFDPKSMMLYSGGYADRDAPSDGDVAAVREINL